MLSTAIVAMASRPQLSDEVWVKASLLYQELYERLTRQSFVPASYPAEARVLAALEMAKNNDYGELTR